MEPTLESPFPRFQRFRPSDLTPIGVMHIVNRVVGGQFLLGAEEKEYLHRLLHKILPFCGLELLTWTILDNHYHLLVRTPNDAEAARLREELTEADVLERMKGAFSAEYIQEVIWRLEKFRRTGRDDMADTIINRLKAQMFDVSPFMHMLKRRFSAWYNKQHGRKGTLWEGRFRSVLVEESDQAVLMMAAYIDLNAVRAGIVKDPKDYRWCGYAEALSGEARAQYGISEVVRASSQDSLVHWEDAREIYRGWFYGIGAEETAEAPGSVVRRGFSPEEIRAVQDRGGKLSPAQLLHCRVRYFVDGIAIGSSAFVDSIFHQHKERFGKKRETGARPCGHGGIWNGLCSLRDLRKSVISAPDQGSASRSSP